MAGKPRLLVFASGDEEGGGSGFEKLVEMACKGYLHAEIVGVVSNYENGGVKEKARRLGVPFEFFDVKTLPKEMEKDSEKYNLTMEEEYQRLYRKYKSPWVSLSGWLLFVRGLPTQKVINIHPGPLPEFGGDGMYGHHVHEAVIAAFKEGKVTHSAVSMHFVDPGKDYDKGPLIFMFPVKIEEDDTPKTLASKVNQREHDWQWFITNLAVNGQIRLEGDQVIVPQWFTMNRIIAQK